jgi:hypothetical protein
MNYRLNAVKTVSKRRIYETLLSPEFYILQAVGLLLGYFLVKGFVQSIDSSGFNPEISPLYTHIVGTLLGIFGNAFVEKLFSEGPFIFSFLISFAPVSVYLPVSSVFRFGLEKNVGAIELLTYGPLDGTSYILAFMVKDALMTAIYSSVLTIFFLLAAVVFNLLLGPMYFVFILMFFFLTMSVYSYGMLASVLTDNPASSIILFSVILIFFTLIQLGSFTTSYGYIRNFSTVLEWIVKWISPHFYWNMGLRAAYFKNAGQVSLCIFYLLLLSSAVLFASHFVLKLRGVRV